jgi:glucose/arabinose dehydrogenase
MCLSLASLVASLGLALAGPPLDQVPAPAPAATPPAAANATTQTEAPEIALERLWPEMKLNRPIQMIQRPDAPNLWYLAEQPGTIRLLDTSKKYETEAPMVVDLTAPVNDKSNEEGLLSIAFHPDFPKKRELYVYYTAHPPRRSVLSRFTVSEDGLTVDPKSEEIILEQSQPYWNHNGGTVLFGKDGFLYLSLGDGGAANDPHGNGQSLKTFLAKILRIDVNQKANGKNYAIPADNPFVGREDALPEIWALGLRNAWRMHFDRETGELWAGDVGQNLWEEIDLIVKGGNYGWNKREGKHDFAGKAAPDLIDPVVDYSHREGVSVTGGFVYRGKAIEGLRGAYLYADFGYPNIWAIRMKDGVATKPKLVAKKTGSLIASFAEDNEGELLLLTFEGGQNAGQPGAIWRVRPR